MPRTANYVRLIDPESGIVVVGRLAFRPRGVVEIKGTVEGIALENYCVVRPSQLRGISSHLGNVWLDQIFKFEPTVSMDPEVPTIVRLRAIEFFFGKFDPRAGGVVRVTASLKRLQSLYPFRPFEETVREGRVLTRTYNLIEEPLSIFANEQVEVTLDRLIRVGSNVSFRQALSATFTKEVKSSSASATLDNVLLLISVLTQSDVVPRTLTYVDAERNVAFERRALKKRSEPLRQHEWLLSEEGMLPLLRKTMGHWLEAMSDRGKNLLVRWFMTALHDERTVESKFLLLCQCFEELNRRRVSPFQYDPEAYERHVVKPLQQAISGLEGAWIRSDLRSRLASAVKEAKQWRLRDRIAETLKLLPQFSRTVKGRIRDVRMRIERRRNLLSHGDPAGGIEVQLDFDHLCLELTVIRGLCLAEVLLLAGVDGHEVDSLVLGDADVRHFEWLAQKIEREGDKR